MESSAATNAVGNPTSYAIEGMGNAISLLAEDDWPQRRAMFTKKHLWVTPYAPRELHAGGDYPNQSRGGDGLPAWTGANRAIEDTDIVLWYTLGFHHLTASEDWPVLGAHTRSFVVRPVNFFDRNPTINMPKFDLAAGP